MASYSYSLAVDFPQHVVQLTQLTEEIHAPAISSTVLQYINQSGDVVEIVFDADLSPADKTILDGIVAVHVPIVVTQTVQIAKSLGETVITSLNWVEKVNLNSAPLRKGVYQITWYCEVKADVNCAVQVFFRGQEQAFTSWNRATYHAFSGAVAVAIAEGNSPNVKLNAKMLVAGTMTIQRARLAIILLDAADE